MCRGRPGVCELASRRTLHKWSASSFAPCIEKPLFELGTARCMSPQHVLHAPPGHQSPASTGLCASRALYGALAGKL